MKFNKSTEEATAMVATPTPAQSDIDNTSLTSDELAFQCLVLTKAAILNIDAAARETLLFILLEKTHALYRMLPEAEAASD